jgi:ACR3 family arsenite efflux pump ArsB
MTSIFNFINIADICQYVPLLAVDWLMIKIIVLFIVIPLVAPLFICYWIGKILGRAEERDRYARELESKQRMNSKPVNQ